MITVPEHHVPQRQLSLGVHRPFRLAPIVLLSNGLQSLSSLASGLRLRGTALWGGVAVWAGWRGHKYQYVLFPLMFYAANREGFEHSFIQSD